MASGYNGRDLRGSYGYGVGSAVFQQQRSDGAGGLLKRSLTEIERQQQVQHALYLRSVKPRTVLNSPIDLSSSSSPSGTNYLRAQQRQSSNSSSDLSFITPAEFERKSTIKNQLQELERQLLLDEEDDDEASATGSAVTASELQQLISPIQNTALSPSPTTSSSSTSSSSASCSPSSSTQSKQLLLDTAAAIAEGNFETAAANLAALKQAANPRGDPDQRLTAMMVPALVSRLNPPTLMGASPIAELCGPEQQTASQMLYDASPCFKLGLMAANFAILDTAKDHAAIHIVDFDFGGGQYASLINSLAERSRHRFSPSVRITAICDPTFPFNTANTVNNLRLIGSKIVTLGKRFGVPVRFDVMNRRASELDRATLGCEPGEVLAVNFAFVLSRIADESVSPANPRDELLRRVRSLEPAVVTVVEHEMNANTAPFAARFSEACKYYGSILESLEATSSRENSDRARVESCLARKAANSIAREGPDRVERPEVLGKWRARMSMAGLKLVGFGPGVAESVKSHFGLMKVNPGFTLKEEGGGLGFGWMGRVLTVASAWR